MSAISFHGNGTKKLRITPLMLSASFFLSVFIAAASAEGAKSELKWTRGMQGLEIEVPNALPCKYAFSFRILSG